jgi:regulator of protease activity HflC (stomatin/prohibitin superfamily)
MNRIKLVAILAVLGTGAYVSMSSIYTVSEVEQVIITQFGKPVGAPVTSAGLKFKLPFIQDPGSQSDRQTGSRVGRPPVGHADQGQALHLGRPFRPLADYGATPVLSAAAR